MREGVTYNRMRIDVGIVGMERFQSIKERKLEQEDGTEESTWVYDEDLVDIENFLDVKGLISPYRYLEDLYTKFYSNLYKWVDPIMLVHLAYDTEEEAYNKLVDIVKVRVENLAENVNQNTQYDVDTIGALDYALSHVLIKEIEETERHITEDESLRANLERNIFNVRKYEFYQALNRRGLQFYKIEDNSPEYVCRQVIEEDNDSSIDYLGETYNSQDIEFLYRDVTLESIYTKVLYLCTRDGIQLKPVERPKIWREVVQRINKELVDREYTVEDISVQLDKDSLIYTVKSDNIWLVVGDNVNYYQGNRHVYGKSLSRVLVKDIKDILDNV